MASSIFGQQRPQGVSSIFSLLGAVRSGGGPEAFARQMMESNPSFKSFVEANQGKTPEQIAQENGIDFNQVKSLLK